jgi:hypothetical protein
VIIALAQLNNAKVHRDADVLFTFSGGRAGQARVDDAEGAADQDPDGRRAADEG